MACEPTSPKKSPPQVVMEDLKKAFLFKPATTTTSEKLNVSVPTLVSRGP
eukprot:gene20391-26130_t